MKVVESGASRVDDTRGGIRPRSGRIERNSINAVVWFRRPFSTIKSKISKKIIIRHSSFVRSLSIHPQRRLPLGMSDIGAAFKHMSANRVDNARYLFISDGIATHGTTNAATIQAAFDSAASVHASLVSINVVCLLVCCFAGWSSVRTDDWRQIRRNSVETAGGRPRSSRQHARSPARVTGVDRCCCAGCSGLFLVFFDFFVFV